MSDVDDVLSMSANGQESVPSDPVMLARGKYAGRGPVVDQVRHQDRQEEAESELRHGGRAPSR